YAGNSPRTLPVPLQSHTDAVKSPTSRCRWNVLRNNVSNFCSSAIRRDSFEDRVLEKTSLRGIRQTGCVAPSVAFTSNPFYCFTAILLIYRHLSTRNEEETLAWDFADY